MCVKAFHEDLVGILGIFSGLLAASKGISKEFPGCKDSRVVLEPFPEISGSPVELSKKFQCDNVMTLIPIQKKIRG